MVLDIQQHACSNAYLEHLYWRRYMAIVVLAIAVVLCSAYLLWQIWEADLVEDR